MILDPRIGDRVKVVQHIDNWPDASIAPGETGTIDSIESDCWWVALDTDHPELAEWQNRIQIWDWSPQDGEEQHPSRWLERIEA